MLSLFKKNLIRNNFNSNVIRNAFSNYAKRNFMQINNSNNNYQLSILNFQAKAIQENKNFLNFEKNFEDIIIKDNDIINQNIFEENFEDDFEDINFKGRNSKPPKRVKLFILFNN